MITIKRYANRKLYNPVDRHYISLDDLARLIRQGEEVCIIDHGTENDITSHVLAQVISTHEKKSGGLAPLNIMLRLIQAGDRGLKTLGEALQVFQNPMQYVDGEISQRLQTLESEKTLSPEQYTWLRSLLLDERWEETYKRSISQEEAMRDEYLLLSQKIKSLEEEIQKL